MRNKNSYIALFLMLSVSIMGMGIINSCSGIQDVECQQTNDKYYSQLKNELDSMSADFMNSHRSTMETRGFFSKLWNAVKADVNAISDYNAKHRNSFFGVIIPLQETATASSAAFYGEEFRLPSYARSKAVRTVVDSLSSVYAYSSANPTYSDAHNSVILALIKDDAFKPNDLYTTAQRIKYNARLLRIRHTDGPIENTVSLVENLLDNDNMAEEPNLMTDFDAWGINILESYLDYVTNLENINDIKEYTDEYIQLVDSSPILHVMGEERMEHLLGLIRMTASSYDLWYHLSELSVFEIH